uniref:Arginine--tRNA ligase n=1 Tax=Fervidicoccus fontis TaxID=683846 RepID=A0A7J3ZKN5_9CREN
MEEVRAWNPYGYIRECLASAISEFTGVPSSEVELLLAEPPEHVGADLGLPLKRFVREIKPDELSRLLERIRAFDFVEKVELESGYLNVWFSPTAISETLFYSLSKMKESYGKPLGLKRLKVVVEHTSANPVHPLHVGHGRNASIGDSLARLLSFAGHEVSRRFYINDVGRQSAILAYGLSLLGGRERWLELAGSEKIDHWMGLVYALTNLMVELAAVKRRLKQAKTDQEYRDLIEEQDGIVFRIAKLSERNKTLFELLAEGVMRDENPEESIRRIMLGYERGEDTYKRLVREAVELVIMGFKETLSRLNVEFDEWDWESSLVWDGPVEDVLERARKTAFYTVYKNAEALDLSPLASLDDVRERLRIPKRLDVPPLILRRSDGTTLYTTRDIAYSIKKFADTGADLVINVIAKEQTLPQAQVRLALYALSFRDFAENMIHYSHEMVSVPGMKMSARTGEYVALDEILSLLYKAVLADMESRGVSYSLKEMDEIARRVASAALKYYLVSVDAEKPIELKLEEIIDFNRNTAPYLLYSYARAQGILRKAGLGFKVPESHKWVLEDGLRYALVKRSLQFPHIVLRAVKELKPHLIVEYLGDLTRVFNKWYDRDPVVVDEVEDRRTFKLGLVYGVSWIIKNSLNILGIEPLEKM